jgi:uncharacterized protein YfiM (DUF2279 family)
VKVIWLRLGLFFLVLCPLKSQAFGQSLPATDKAAHFSVSSLGVASFVRFSQWFHPEKEVTPMARFLASSFLLSLGLGKELNDAKRNGSAIDAGDMAANVAGVVYGNLLMIEF